MNQTTFENKAMVFNFVFLSLIAISSTTYAFQEPGKTDQKSPDLLNQQTAKGVVFCDLNGDGKYNTGDSAFVGIKVSNGTDIVKTDRGGRYEIPIEDGGCVFVIKPTGYRTPINQHQLPQVF